MGKGRVPDFFIVGHEKCGTTALYDILKQHPQIFMPDLKEPRFFVPKPRNRKPARGKPVRPRTREEYLALFADATPEQRAGEASPQYIRFPEAAPAIAQMQPAARIIAILKEPTRFVRSYHLSCVRGLIETERDLGKAISLEAERRQGRSLPPDCPAVDRLFYREHARYPEQLRRFEKALSRDQMLVLIYDDFLRDNDATARRVLRFLGLDDTLALDIPRGDQTDNLSRGRRGRKAVRLARMHRAALALQRASRKPHQAGRLALTVNALTPKWLHGEAAKNMARRAVFAVPAPADEQLMRELRRQFKPEVEALSAYLGRDLLSLWGYDQVR